MFTSNIFLVILSLVYQASAITLNNGGYEDVYIVIQDSIEEDLVLLDRIQDVFTEASQLLFTATKQRVYFRKIKVVIPKSWSTQARYTQLPALSSLETHIDINNSNISTPFVRFNNYECGEQGISLNLQPSFFLQNIRTLWGKHANVIVHAWGNLRWGLFDEYPDRYGERFYQHAGEWKPVICSQKIEGKIGYGKRCSETPADEICNTKDTSKNMKDECYFCPYTEQNVNISLMAYQYIDQLTMFCDKDDESVNDDQRHNSIAPNMQNKFCDGKSAWEVMREHEDFIINPDSLNSNTNTSPEFEFIQEGDVVLVLVLDVSGSMNTNDRIGLLNQAGRYIIQECFPEGSWLGIVTFESDAHTNIELTQINSQADRDTLIADLPSSASGGTCIGCGIDQAISILTAHVGSSVQNGGIILISDGLNNAGNIDASRANARSSLVTINTIAVSQQADTLLTDIATETGGKSYTYLESGNFSFAAVFRQAICGRSSITSVASQSIVLLSEKIVSDESNVIHTSFQIENGLGKNTSVTVLTVVETYIHLQLNGPENYTYAHDNDGNTNTATIKIDGFAKVGDYNLTITTKLNIGQSVEYHVTSSPITNSNDVIRVESRLSKINIDLSTGDLPVVLVDVMKNNVPVINATVIAIVESDGVSCSFYIYDNGTDPDRLKNDGTYSGYILPQCLGSGRVNIRVKVAGKAGETFLIYGNTGYASQNEEEDETEETIHDSFQRNVVTEELYISKYTYSESVDSIAPGRITDVEINSIETDTTPSGENRNLTLTWTATGDDRNQGQATSYEMRISSDIGTLRDNFESAELLNMTNSTIYPQDAGTIEALKIVVNAEESYVETVFFAVRAIDEDGNEGPVSNIVSIIVARGFRASGEQGYVVNETDNDIILDQESPSPSGSQDDDIDMRAIIIGVTVSCGIILFLVIASLFFKKIKQQKASVADSQVSIISKDTTTTKVQPYQSHPSKIRFASSSLPVNLPKHASPGIHSDKSRHKNQPSFQNSATKQTFTNSGPSGNGNVGNSNEVNKNDETVVNIESDAREIGIERNRDFKLKDETILDMEDESTEFADPDDYITQTNGNRLPVINIPFYLTNKCGKVETYIPKEAINNDLPNVKIVDSSEKDKVLENLPALPFSTEANLDRSHPPPNIALHILEPSEYGIGKKPYVFPSPFSGVKDSYKNSRPATTDDDITDDIFDDADSLTENDEMQSETESQLSLEYPDDSSETHENLAFDNKDEEPTYVNDDERNVNKAEDEDDLSYSGSYEAVSENVEKRAKSTKE